jgi:hypothetical protein
VCHRGLRFADQHMVRSPWCNRVDIFHPLTPSLAPHASAVGAACVVRSDVTVAESDAAAAAAATRVLQEQQLSNCMRSGQWVDAVGLALELQQPRRLLAVLDEIELAQLERYRAAESQESTGGPPASAPVASLLGDVLCRLTLTQLGLMLKYVRDWNTHGKHALLANRVLQALFRSQGPAQLKQCPEVRCVPHTTPTHTMFCLLCLFVRLYSCTLIFLFCLPLEVARR